ncbi:MAG: hypothetical protein HOV80_04865 [Polyangiaceae bacterium]|nr:hypothetical protein [Polyangiaceae bacterium]
MSRARLGVLLLGITACSEVIIERSPHGDDGDGGNGGAPSSTTLVVATATAATGSSVDTSSSVGTSSSVVSTSSGSTSSSAGGAGGSGGGPEDCEPGTVASCFDGPPEAAGVGECAMGVAVCLPDGSAFGPCEGDILPTSQQCGTGIDQDCDGFVSVGCDATTVDAGAATASNSGYSHTLAFDPDGDLFIAGDFSGTSVTVGGLTVATPAGQGQWLAKLTPSLDAIWIVTIPGNLIIWNLASDADGRVVIAGRATGAINFGGGPISPPATQDLFAAAYDANGAFEWAHVAEGDGSNDLPDVATLPDGDVVLVSNFTGSLQFEGAPVLSSAGSYDAFVARLDGSSGTAEWADRYGASGQEVLFSVACTPSGQILVGGGAVTGDAVLDFGVNATIGGPFAIAFARLEGDGTPVWSGGFDGLSFGFLHVASGPTGDLYATGAIDGPVDFGDGTIGSPTSDDLFIARFDTSGQLVFSRSFGDSTGNQRGQGIAVDSLGNVLLTGWVQDEANGTIDLGGGPVPVADDLSIFVSKYTPLGDHMWSSVFGSLGYSVYDIDVAPDGTSAIIGMFTTGFDVGTGPLVADGTQDTFIALFAP